MTILKIGGKSGRMQLEDLLKKMEIEYQAETNPINDDQNNFFLVLNNFNYDDEIINVMEQVRKVDI